MLPAPIYEAAPFAYSGIGVLALLSADNLLGYLSSGLLISAALIIFSLRHRYRAGFPQGW